MLFNTDFFLFSFWVIYLVLIYWLLSCYPLTNSLFTWSLSQINLLTNFVPHFLPPYVAYKNHKCSTTWPEKPVHNTWPLFLLLSSIIKSPVSTLIFWKEESPLSLSPIHHLSSGYHYLLPVFQQNISSPSCLHPALLSSFPLSCLHHPIDIALSKTKCDVIPFSYALTINSKYA